MLLAKSFTNSNNLQYPLGKHQTKLFCAKAHKKADGFDAFIFSHEMQKTSILVDFPFEFNNQSPVFVQNVYKVF